MGCSVIEALHEKYRDDEPQEFVNISIRISKNAPGREGKH